MVAVGPGPTNDTMNLDIRCASAGGMLVLSAFRGVGSHIVNRLANEFGTLQEVRNASPARIRSICSRSVSVDLTDTAAWQRALANSQAILEAAQQHSVRVLAPTDADYPEWLREIPAPPVIHVKGELRPDRRQVACVGTRDPSPFGEIAARRITRRLVESDWSIVSGLARGVDTLAHRAALEAGGHTVAVLATGLDSVYPLGNTELARDILERGGALLSEHPVGTPLIPHNLIQRDRLQSGMAAGTVVMQTDVTGGSMHTVRFTLEQGRLLFAPIPAGRHALAPKSRGILALARTTGRELADTLNADEIYRKLLTTKFGNCPPAIPIRDRREYVVLLDRLQVAVKDCSGMESARMKMASQDGYARGGLPLGQPSV